MHKSSSLGLILLIALTFAAPRADAQSANDPSTVVADLLGAMTRAAGAAELSAQDREQKLQLLLRDRFDLPAIARSVLGHYSATASQQEQTNFAGLFERWMIENYAMSVKGFDGAAVKLTGTRPDGADGAVVTSEIPRSGDDPFTVEWRLRRNDGQYRIVDVDLGGISMVQVEREQIAAVIQQNGGTVAGLNHALETRLGADKSSIALSDAH